MGLEWADRGCFGVCQYFFEFFSTFFMSSLWRLRVIVSGTILTLMAGVIALVDLRGMFKLGLVCLLFRLAEKGKSRIFTPCAVLVGLGIVSLSLERGALTRDERHGR